MFASSMQSVFDNFQFLLQSSGQKVSIDFNGFATLQPTVRLVRLPLPISPPKRRGRRPKAVQSRRDRTSSSLVRARGRTRTHRVSAVQTFSDQSESDRSTPPKLKINRSDKKLVNYTFVYYQPCLNTIVDFVVFTCLGKIGPNFRYKPNRWTNDSWHWWQIME